MAKGGDGGCDMTDETQLQQNTKIWICGRRKFPEAGDANAHQIRGQRFLPPPFFFGGFGCAGSSSLSSNPVRSSA